MLAKPRVQGSKGVNRGYVRAGPLEMYYEAQGKGRPLVLLHGGFATIESSFRALRPAFIERWNTLALEQQGHGHTDDLDRPLSHEQMVEDTASALEHLGIDDADIFGWSDGGVVALGLAIRHPQLVRRVAIYGAGYGPAAYTDEFRIRLRDLKPEAPELTPYRESYARVAPHPDRWPQLVNKVRDLSFAFNGWQSSELRQLAAPLLVMVGDRDVVQLEQAIELYRMVPRGRLAVFPGTDQAGPLTRAEWLKAILTNYFDPPPKLDEATEDA